VNGKSFPALTLVGAGVGGDTGFLEDAAGKLEEIRDYLFYDDPEPASPSDSKEPASPENMVKLRGFLERIDDKLAAVTTAHGPGTGPAGRAPRDTLSTARSAVRVTKGVAEEWDKLRNDPGPEKWAIYRLLLDRQQEVEESISTLARQLREFVRVIVEIRNGGPGQAPAGNPQRPASRGRVMDGRPHYIPWHPPGAGRAS
jgi:hypothetical protein